jgi:hypothetical protein
MYETAEIMKKKTDIVRQGKLEDVMKAIEIMCSLGVYQLEYDGFWSDDLAAQITALGYKILPLAETEHKNETTAIITWA